MAELLSAPMLRRVAIGRGPIERPAANLPQSTQSPLYTVTGLVAVMIVGEVTTAIQNLANNTKLVGNPTVGTDVDLCAVASIANKEVGSLLGITGLTSDALLVANAGGLSGPARYAIVNAGTIDLNCAASATGQVKWRLYYVPLDDNAEVSAA